MLKYKTVVGEINCAIAEFSKFLSDSVALDCLSDELGNEQNYVNIRNKEWEKTHWPNQENAGVYFLFGINKANEADVAVYIGKASLGAKIGNRIYTHLNKDRANGDYSFSDKDGNSFRVEFTSGLNFEKGKIVFLAPALEEFLITRLAGKVHLMNVSGNKA